MNDYTINDYAGIDLIPNYSELISRKNADCSVGFGPRIFKLPICPANMVCCINTERAKWLSENGYFYIMHRFDGKQNPKDLRFFVEKANNEKWNHISISVGVNKIDKDLIEWIKKKDYHVDYTTIDVAHGHHALAKETIKTIKGNIKTFIIAGNVATPQAVSYLINNGADAVKIGIGAGKCCTTRLKTGFHVPMFRCALECATSCIPTIVDGGIRHNGDIAKALVGIMNKGFNPNVLVMAGSIFAACTDSPAKNIYDWTTDDTRTPTKCKIKAKEYFGSASYENGNKKNIEGTLIEIPCNQMTYAEKLKEIRQDLSSSISYAGGKDLSAFANVKWLERN